jgi:hypothetical protein
MKSLNDVGCEQRAVIELLLLRNNQWKTSTKASAMSMQMQRHTKAPFVAGRKQINV